MSVSWVEVLLFVVFSVLCVFLDQHILSVVGLWFYSYVIVQLWFYPLRQFCGILCCLPWFCLMSAFRSFSRTRSFSLVVWHCLGQHIDKPLGFVRFFQDLSWSQLTWWDKVTFTPSCVRKRFLWSPSSRKSVSLTCSTPRFSCRCRAAQNSLLNFILVWVVFEFLKPTFPVGSMICLGPYVA